jgi:SAM-dependent methyltransferase
VASQYVFEHGWQLEGRVVATDLEIDFLGHLEDEPNIEVRRHDIVEDDLEEEVYDLVHARLVLEHIPERELCLKRLCTALAPGGLLVLEDFDWGSASPINEADRPLFDEVLAAAVETFRSVGYDDTWARRMFGGFREAGLVEVGAEGWVPVGRAGTAIAEWWQLSLEKLRPVVLARTSLSDDVFERYMDMVSAPDFAFVFLTLITAWGRRPGV